MHVMKPQVMLLLRFSISCLHDQYARILIFDVIPTLCVLVGQMVKRWAVVAEDDWGQRDLLS